MKAFIVGAFIAGYLILGGMDARDAKKNDQEPTTTVCVEDMDCWECKTMGNKLCGPTGYRP